MRVYEWKDEELKGKKVWGVLIHGFGLSVFWVRFNYQVNHSTFPDLPNTGERWRDG